VGAAIFLQECELWPKGVHNMARPHNRFSLGVKIQMSKKLFLAAASVAALALAGGANAGTLTGGFGTAGAGTFTASAPYLVASEKTVAANAKATGVVVATNTLSTPIVLASGAQRDHLVTFTVTGATTSSPALTFASTGGGSVNASLVSNTDGVATFIVTAAGDINITAMTLTANVEQSAQASITVASNVKAIIGASEIPVDNTTALTVAKYQPLLGAVKVDANDVYSSEADLADGYTTLNSGDTGALLAEDFYVVNAGDFHSDLNNTGIDAGDVLGGAVITVRGPAINEAIGVNTIGTLDTDNTEANTAVFELDASQAEQFAAGSEQLAVFQISSDPEEYGQFRPGTYKLTWAPAAATGYTVPGASTVDAGSITLEGTNFTAPWVSGTGAANSVIRISNSNSVESGAVSVRLISAVKVAGGATTPYTSSAVLDAGTVPAGADLQITSKMLTDAFGDFTRGDVQITINSSTDGFFAKMRNTRDGQTFEQSLNHF
jgi:hypothetical protein